MASSHFIEWITDAFTIQDSIDDIPKSVLLDWWNAIRPDLLISSSNDLRKIRDSGDVNERAWRLGNTGYVQRVRMVEDIVDGPDCLCFTGNCYGQQKPVEYRLRMVLIIQVIFRLFFDYSSIILCTEIVLMLAQIFFIIQENNTGAYSR